MNCPTRRLLFILGTCSPLLFPSSAGIAHPGAFPADLRTTPGNLVVLNTSLGRMTIELFPDRAPVTVQNFLRYVNDRFYDGTVFHRVIGKPHAPGDFMIQGGGYERGMKEKKTRAPIKNEAANGLSNRRGTIAMARTVDPNSATAQFFINVADNKFLDRSRTQPGYCVFGRVVQGMNVVDRIKAVATGNRGGHQNVPLQDIVLESARLGDK